MAGKEPFRFIRKWTTTERHWLTGKPETRTHCEYEASFWEGPIEAGQTGRYRRLKSTHTILGGEIMGVSPNVSFYGELKKACRL